ncbi:hypothetical protein CK500_02660 [Halorubrum salipaludis]|uniref:DUF1616 domain-containing protein n=1 Tax=Halorubrum salipaludis TaxID=2032630 RepID=A0A2A2FLY1_9EURY|nr:DUF1616 domain-containing protein [Halorubrum salipaludis]PAU85583.1 hypothetical protein CK500_02660 [Halorubrum salipaludis]
MSNVGGNSRPRTADLFAVVASVLLAIGVAFTPLGEWRPIAVAFGLPFVLLVPGYALVSAVFPRAGETAPRSEGQTSWTARLGLSVAASTVTVALVGVALDFTVWGFGRTAVVVGLSVVTLGATSLAWYRRRRLPVTAQAGASVDAVRARVRSVALGDGLAGVALTLVVLVAAVGAVGVVADESTGTASVTEFYVLGEDGSGDLVAGSYPSNATAGEPTTLGVGVGTLRSDFDGRVVVSLERVTVEGDAVSVDESRELDRFDVRVSAGETNVTRRTVRPRTVGERLRLTARLYRDGSDSPVRQVHVWLTVRPA